MNLKKILYIEANVDGTVGGSHYCLYEIVKFVDRNKYIPLVLFYQDNSIVQDLKKICDVYIYDQKKALIMEMDFPNLYRIFNKIKILKQFSLFFQKFYNFFALYIPNLVFIYKFLKKHRVDLIHANNTPDLSDWLIVSKLLKIKIISHLRGPWYPNTLGKMLIVHYDKIISISNYVTNRFKEEKVPNNNVVIIHDGIDCKSVNVDIRLSENILKEWNISKNTPVIGVIGNIRRWKGQHVAIESIHLLVKKYKNIRGIFVGNISNSPHDKDYLNYLNELVIKYNLENNIIFTGFRKDIYEIIHNLDIIVHTSIQPEPLGRVIFEGMILCKPVIATNHGGPVEIIEDGISGFLVPPENPFLLSEKISFLIENKSIASSMGEKARKHVECNFSVEKNVKRIEKVYASLL